MKRRVLDPLDRPFARAVAVETQEFTRVYLSGATGGDGDLAEQTREILSGFDERLQELDGELSDMVRVRVYLNTSLTDDAYEQVNSVRAEFFPSKAAYPASTLVEVTGLVSDKLDIEIDGEAIIPHDDWDTVVLD